MQRGERTGIQVDAQADWIPDFTYTVAFAGSCQRALAAAETAFSQAGFRIVKRSGGELCVASPGMRGKSVNPLRGATFASVTVGGGEIRVNAVLGGAVWVRRVMLLMLVGLAVLFVVGFGIAWAVVPELRDFPWIWYVLLLPLVPWIGLGPVLARAIRRTGEEALQALAGGVASAAAEPDLEEEDLELR